MVEILCPQCEGEIEVNDDALGVFECPLCNGEFEWNVEEDESLMTAQEAHQKMVGSVIQSNNPHGLYKMHPVEEVAEGAFLGVATSPKLRGRSCACALGARPAGELSNVFPADVWQ